MKGPVVPPGKGNVVSLGGQIAAPPETVSSCSSLSSASAVFLGAAGMLM
ncbi:hypothetical protein [Chryseobacterium shandongense]|nr:hypothetical protein [Chryseobacterium shandongense]